MVSKVKVEIPAFGAGSGKHPKPLHRFSDPIRSRMDHAFPCNPYLPHISTLRASFSLP